MNNDYFNQTEQDQNKPKNGLWIFLGVFVGSFIVLGIILFSMKVSYNRQEISIREQIVAEKKIYLQDFDKQWKVVSKIVQVAERNAQQSREGLADIYQKIAQGRKDSDAVFKWIQESNPQWDAKAIAELYQQVNRVIESEAADLYNQSKKLADIIAVRNALIQDPIASFFINNTDPIDVVFITSEKTKKVAEKGEDDDVELFKQKEKK